MASATRRRPTSGLGSFLEALEARLGELTAEQIEAALLAHAEQLPPREREALRAIFADSDRDRAHASVVELGSGGDFLIVEVDAFVERRRAGGYVLGWGWDGEIHEERAFGDESWVGEMDDLFAAAGAAFLAGETELARGALGRLLRSFALEAETRAFCGPDTPERTVSTDLGEAKARYLRAVYETTPASERPGVVLDAIHDLGYLGGDGRLGALEQARRAPLPELDAFLPAWIAHLRLVDDVQPGPPLEGKLAGLLSEAAECNGGADGLGELARSAAPTSRCSRRRRSGPSRRASIRARTGATSPAIALPASCCCSPAASIRRRR